MNKPKYSEGDKVRAFDKNDKPRFTGVITSIRLNILGLGSIEYLVKYGDDVYAARWVPEHLIQLTSA